MKNQKGITLVALVVTIIVLLILAGVSLSLVMGSDGILGRATNARAQYEYASAGERAELLIAEAQTAYYEAKYVGTNPNNYATTSMLAFVKAYLLDTANTTSAGETVVVGTDKIQVTKDSKVIAEATYAEDDDGKMVIGKWKEQTQAGS